MTPQKIHQIEQMTAKEKARLLAEWYQKGRDINHPQLNLLLLLDDICHQVYLANRITQGFNEAQLMANEYVIKLFFTE